MNFNDLLESLSFTRKRSFDDSDRLYDKAQDEKWKAREEKLYGELGEDRERYRQLSDQAYGRATESFDIADQYFGRAGAAYDTALGDVSSARGMTGKVGEMVTDKGYYRGLADRLKEQRQARADIGQRFRGLYDSFDQPYTPGAMASSLIDAFQTLKGEQEKQVNREIAQLAQSNPVAAVKMKNDFNANMLKALTKTQQQGFFGDKQMDVQELAQKTGMLMQENALVTQAEQAIAAEDTMRNQQMAGMSGVVGQYLNTSQQQMAGARGFQGIGGAYTGRGQSQLGVGMSSDQMAGNTLMNRANIASAKSAIQDKYRIRDMTAQQSVQNFNDSRAAMGFNNLLSMGKMATDIYTGGATAAIPGPKVKEGKQYGLFQDDPNSGFYDNWGTDRSMFYTG